MRKREREREREREDGGRSRVTYMHNDVANE